MERLLAVIADLKAQRSHLYAEVARLKEQRNEAIRVAGDAQQANTELLARIAALGHE